VHLIQRFLKKHYHQKLYLQLLSLSFYAIFTFTEAISIPKNPFMGTYSFHDYTISSAGKKCFFAIKKASWQGFPCQKAVIL